MTPARRLRLHESCAIVLGLKIAQANLRTGYSAWTGHAQLLRGALTVHSIGWKPHVILISQGGGVKSLGVHYDLDLWGRTQRKLSTRELKGLLAACRYRVASPDTLKAEAVLESNVLNKIAYRGWSLAFTSEYDCLLAQEYRRRTLNMKSSQEEHIFQSARLGELGF